MKLTDNSILQEDIERASSSGCVDWEQLRGRSVLVTGATGLIGGLLVMTLLSANERLGLGMRVIAAVRNEQKAKELFRYAGTDLSLAVGDITSPLDVSGDIDYIVHGASATSSKYFVEHPVETIITALSGTRNVLELAREKKVMGMVYLSSLEVYGVVDEDHGPVDENCFGRIDPMSVRSSYSEGKRMAENLCASYCGEYGVNVSVCRLCQTFGAGVQYNDGRVFAQFARSVIEGKDIVLRTDGSTKRNYCYISDAVTGILAVLLKGEKGMAYNIANKDTLISLKDMAQLVIGLCPQSGSKLTFDIAEDAEKLGYNPKVILDLATGRAEAIGWRAEVGLEEMFRRLIASMKNTQTS